jgi:hypothetical protein
VDHPSDLVTLSRFPSAGAAEAARSRLEADGIPSLVAERDALRLDPFGGRPQVGIRLQVRPEDVERARQSLGLEPAEEPA